MGLPTKLASDPVARARLLAQIREAVLNGSPAPRAPRPVVSESWRRSLAAQVDPERPTGPPAVFDQREMAQLRSEHPLAATLPLLRETLVAIADEAMHMMIVTDADGHILWREGHRGVLHRADEVGLVEGTRWSEDAIGTNAMGTALAANLAVQIHSAEHLVWTYRNWTCAACPVHDPDTGEIIGVVDVTGPVVGFHPATAGLVNAAAKLAEAHLRGQMQARDERLRARCAPKLASLGAEYGALVAPSGRVLASQPHGWLPTPRLALPPDQLAGEAPLVLADGRAAVLEPLPEGYLLRVPVPARTASRSDGAARPMLDLRFLGRQPTAELDGRPVRLSQRHADMLTLLALHPEGVSAEQLATGVYGERGNPVTARAEIHRLRTHLNAVRTTPPPSAPPASAPPASAPPASAPPASALPGGALPGGATPASALPAGALPGGATSQAGAKPPAGTTSPAATKSPADAASQAGARPTSPPAGAPQASPRVQPVLHSGPYRLDAELTADFLTVRAALREGRVREAAFAYRGELRPGSEAPAVLEERELLAATLRQAVLDAGDVEAMWLLAESDTGRDDVELAELLAAELPRSDPRHAAMTARATRLTT